VGEREGDRQAMDACVKGELRTTLPTIVWGADEN
jgi:hypothetical protein